MTLVSEMFGSCRHGKRTPRGSVKKYVQKRLGKNTTLKCIDPHTQSESSSTFAQIKLQSL